MCYRIKLLSLFYLFICIILSSCSFKHDEVNVVVKSDPETVDKGKMKKYKLCTELEIPEGCFCFEVIGNIKLDAKITCPIAPKIR